MDSQNKRSDNKRYRFYLFHGHRFPGELIDIDFVMRSRLKRPVTLEECPILGDCVLYAVIRVEYDAIEGTTAENSAKYWHAATNKTITWNIERGAPIEYAKPWKDSVEKAILSSASFQSMMRAVQDTSKGLNNIELPYYSWLITPLYIESPREFYEIPFIALPMLQDFWQVVSEGKLDKAEPGEWESTMRKIIEKMHSQSKDKTGAFTPF